MSAIPTSVVDDVVASAPQATRCDRRRAPFAQPIDDGMIAHMEGNRTSDSTAGCHCFRFETSRYESLLKRIETAFPGASATEGLFTVVTLREENKGRYEREKELFEKRVSLAQNRGLVSRGISM